MREEKDKDEREEASAMAARKIGPLPPTLGLGHGLRGRPWCGLGECSTTGISP